MFCFEEIYKAYLKCRKRKRNTLNALVFEQNLIENICNLETSLNNYTYTPKRSVCFLTTTPKLREVFAADFSDRVIHHLIVPILEQIYEPKFIYDSYSNRKNKGIHNASKRAIHFIKATKYYLQLDVKNFFYSIDKNILFYKLKDEIINNYNKVKNSLIKVHEMLWIVNKIIYHDVTKNVIIKGSKKTFLNIPPHKTLFKVHKSNNQGLDFLGYILRPNYTLCKKRVVNNYKYKKAKYLDKYEQSNTNMSIEEIKKFLEVQASFFGHIKHSNSYNLKKTIGDIDEKKYINFNLFN